MPQDANQFAAEMPEWSRWKHAILLNYLGPFAGVLQGFHKVYYVDGFAGAGKYDDGSEGSALRSAELARTIHDSSRNYTLHCINVEPDERVYARLVKNTDQYSQFVTNFQGTFQDNISNILDLIANQPTLFFLDPFGVKEINWDTLLPLLNRKSSPRRKIITELLIRFDVQTISRLAGCVGKPSQECKRNQEALFRVFGIHKEQTWRQLIAQSGKDWSGLTKAYKLRLQEYFKYVVSMPIRKTDNNEFKYYLIFASQNEKAISIINNVLYNVEDMRNTEIYEQTSKLQMSLFGDDDFQLHTELDTLKGLVFDILRSKREIVRADLVTRIATMDNYLGAFSDPHFTAVLGGRPRRFRLPEGFQSLRDERKINLVGSASSSKTVITLL